MDAREQKGLVIAAVCRLSRIGDEWLIPSQSEEAVHRVSLKAQTCTCTDHQESGAKCKHIYAAEFTMQRELFDKKPIDEEAITFAPKPSYKQNWKAYNEAQSGEKTRVQELLFDLCQNVDEPQRIGCGRKPHSIRDSIFAMVYKVYSTFSSRRFTCDLNDAHERGFLSKAFPGVKVCAFFENAALTPILKQLIVRSAAPLRSVETKFAIDSSGFSTNKFVRWFDQKYGCVRQKHHWVKVHIACGVKSNVVTAVRILDRDAADSPQFAPLVQETAQNFTISEVSADKAYTSLENFEAVAECGGTGYLAFKANSTGGKGGLFEKMFHLFQYRRAGFMERYHLRSNVESTFSMVKRKFGDAVRSKTDAAMVNEVLCKFLAHNLCVLTQEECELDMSQVRLSGGTMPLHQSEFPRVLA